MRVHHEDVQRGRLTRRPQHVDQILDVNAHVSSLLGAIYLLDTVTKIRFMYSRKMKLHGLVSNSYIHVSVNDLYIPRTSLPICLQQNRQTDLGNK